MENDPIKTKILADYKTLLGLKFNSPKVVYDKLKLISEHTQQLTVTIPEEQEKLAQATTLLQSAMEAGYTALHEAVTNDDKEKALAEIKHKAAEACQLIGLHG